MEVDIPAGPAADKLTLWPVDDGRYGLDAAFQGASGYERRQDPTHDNGSYVNSEEKGPR
jgi:hypothetical protein